MKSAPKPKQKVVVKTLQRKMREVPNEPKTIKTKTMPVDKDLLVKVQGKMTKSLLNSGQNSRAYVVGMSGAAGNDSRIVKAKMDRKPYPRNPKRK